MDLELAQLAAIVARRHPEDARAARGFDAGAHCLAHGAGIGPIYTTGMVLAFALMLVSALGVTIAARSGAGV